tara:strand:+ start:8397 stop:8582 length:186 start_codon:yes stop_codon:yes gene_type:complete
MDLEGLLCCFGILFLLNFFSLWFHNLMNQSIEVQMINNNSSAGDSDTESFANAIIWMNQGD